MLTPVENVLQRATPESQGIASAAILQFVEALDSQINELHSVMLLRHGSVVAEGWWSPYERTYPHVMFSLSKSFTSTAVGLAVTEGHFSIDDPVISFFPDDTPAEISEFLAAMQVRHLLSMSTGNAVDTWHLMVDQPDPNWIKAFLAVPVLHQPGTHFLYNTGATYMLAAIVQKTTGLKLLDYLQPRLFEPLGIENPTWQESPQGINLGGIGLNIKTEDVARFGQLYLQKGMWGGVQLVPESWITEATSSHISNGDDPDNDWAQGYGYQFWRCRHNNYRGDGAFGQYCVVMPQHDAVLAITGAVDALDMQPPLNLLWEILLPAMRPDPLPEDTAAHAALLNKLSNLALPPVQGQASSPIASQVSVRTYTVDANAFNLETIALKFAGDTCTVTLNTATGAESFPCGYDTWQHGQTSLFNQHGLVGLTPVVTSGAWTAEDSFTMRVRLVETPFFYTLTCHFAGDDLMLEAQVNVSFGSTAPILLTAHAV